MYVASSGANALTVVDPARSVVLGSIAVGREPHQVLALPGGRGLYVGNFGEDTVSVVDLARREVGRIKVGQAPTRLAATPDGRSLYAGNAGDGTVSVIDAASRSVRETLAVGGSPIGLAVSPDGSRLFVADNAANEFAMVDLAGKAVARLAVGTKPVGLAVALAPAGEPTPAPVLPRTGGASLAGWGMWAAGIGLFLLGAATPLRARGKGPVGVARRRARRRGSA